MIIFLTSILCTIFIAIACLHIFWAFGGKWGAADAVPSKETGGKLFSPSPFSCVIVALTMIVMAVLVLQYSKLIHLPQIEAISNYGVWVVAAVFLIRAIGDFKYIGFFKKIRTTAFAKNDTKYYSPLCLLICGLCLLLYFMM